MLSYLASRVALRIVVLAGLSVVIFAIARVVPGDPARIVLGPLATSEQVTLLRHEMGFDRPLIVQYGRYVGDLLLGDLGQSILTQRSVNADMATAFPATLELMLSSLLLVLVVAISGGALAARYRATVIDGGARALSLLGVVTPSFVIATCLQVLAGYVLHMLPIAGRLDPNVDFRPDVTGFMIVDALIAGRPPLFRCAAAPDPADAGAGGRHGGSGDALHPRQHDRGVAPRSCRGGDWAFRNAG